MRARPALLALGVLVLLSACGSNKTQASLDTCNADLATANSQLKTCKSDSSTCTSTLGTCQTDVGTCSSALTTCQTGAESCGSNLSGCQGNLATAQGDLTTCQTNLGAAQAALAALTATDADLTSALTAQGVSFADAPDGYSTIPTTKYTFAADGTFVRVQTLLACTQMGMIAAGPTQSLSGTWTVSGSTVTLTFTTTQTTASLTAVKASDGTVNLVDFTAKQFYAHS